MRAMLTVDRAGIDLDSDSDHHSKINARRPDPPMPTAYRGDSPT